MGEALLRKRIGIPAALLALLVITGVAAAVLVATYSYTTTTKEPLSYDRYDNLDIEYQGESDDIGVSVMNFSSIKYGLFVDVDVKSGQVDSITCKSGATPLLLVSTEKDQGDLNRDGDYWDARYNIPAGVGTRVIVTVDSADDGSSGLLKVVLGFHRKAEY